MTDQPVMQVVPIEDLDKIEKLLDVALNLVEMPHLTAIKNACLDELAQINASMEEAQGAALETYNKEMADWEAAERTRKAAEAKKAEEAEKRAKNGPEAGYERRI